jgi:hypothetical protein
MDRKRSRVVGSAGDVDVDPLPLLTAQHKAVSVELGHYRQRVTELEAREAAKWRAREQLEAKLLEQAHLLLEEDLGRELAQLDEPVELDALLFDLAGKIERREHHG